MVLLISKQKAWFQIILLMICFGYVMGASESFAVFVLFLCVSTLVLWTIPKRADLNSLFQNPRFQKLLFITCFSILIFSFLFFGPGTQHRKSVLRQAGLFDTFFLPARTLVYLFIRKITMKLPLLIVFVSPFFAAGTKLKWIENKLKADSYVIKLFSKKSLALATFLMLALNYLALMPACYIMSDRGPERSFTVNSFLLLVYFIYLSLYAGVHLKSKRIVPFQVVTALAAFLFLSYSLVTQLKSAPVYSKSIDDRIVLVQKENQEGRKKVLDLEPLPSSGYYYSAELSPDTSFYTNVFFKQYFGLNYNCRVENGITH